MNKRIDRYQLEDEYKWRDWCKKIPFLKFPGWEVQIIPPFAGALVRFIVRKGDNSVSVYLDVDNSLGYWTDDDGSPEPYWEIYPAANGDTWRCDMDQTFALQHAIAEALK